MARPTRIETIDDIKTWIADHDGRIDAYWEAQFKLNDKIEGKFGSLYNRLEALEKRVMWFAGVAAGVGSVIGGLLTRVW